MKHTHEIEVLARGVFVRNGRLLVCHTRGADNTYLPGGHVEFREAARESLRREVEEELGLKAVVGRFLGVAEHTFRQDGERHCEVNLVFEMDLPSLAPGRIPRSREKHLDFRWLPLTRLSATDLEPAPLRRVLRGWVAARRGVAGWSSTLED